MRVAVAGGTGLVGRLVVGELRKAGHEPVVLARSNGIDLISGDGLAEALAGCDEIIDVSNKNTLSRKQAVEFFTTAATNLLNAGSGAKQVITLSIVGIDDVALGYYLGKRAQEEVVRNGPVPWSILRATQFHAFPEQLIDSAPGPFTIVPNSLSQPVGTTDVARALVAQVGRPAAGYLRPIAGPERLRMADMTRRLVKARGVRKMVLPIRLPGAVGKAMAGGALLPRDDFTEGRETFAEYLHQVEKGRR
ncbi:SDR family oxidoreductase [Kutzneria chonburiensis]|uniref:SDR family oxidoreductase n=1 Tax=Kutzneria chonburiensis TaxID=1483604 RepID=A0ABV6MKB0_9PSEU|nr:NAD(P)H-binding protein [Kutzneria chonburiensis]